MAYVGYYAGQNFPIAQNAGASAGPFKRFPFSPRQAACPAPSPAASASKKKPVNTTQRPRMAYYADGSFPVAQSESAGPYKMFFAPTRGGGCGVSFYRPSQAIARFITPGGQLMSGLGQLDFTDPTTLALLGIAGFTIIYFLSRAGRSFGASRRRARKTRAARMRAQAAALEAA